MGLLNKNFSFSNLRRDGKSPPQNFKQMAQPAGFGAVFEIADAFRADPSFTSRHATEFTSVDAEFSWVESHLDVMAMHEEVLVAGFTAVKEKYGKEIEDVFADLVVVRGEEPVPPRELLPLRPPVNARPVRRRRPGGESADVTGERAPAEAPQLPERGPEITEVR